jgi:hypothetical protein
MYKKPEYATLEEWEQWRINAKRAHPIKFFLYETLPSYIRRRIYRYYTRPIWYIQDRFITKTHLIDTKLRKGYFHAVDTKMLYGCFELLSDYYETEKDQVDYLASLTDEKEYHHAVAAKEVMDLYNWWKQRKPSPFEYGTKEEEAYYKEENEMLIRLIKIRKTLW